MPVLLHQQPVLTLALDSFQDTTIDESDIRRMWIIFTKCKDDIKNGFRLENISWRIWYKKYLNNSSDLFSNDKIYNGKDAIDKSNPEIHSVDSNSSNFSSIEPIEVLKKCACGEQLISTSLNSLSTPHSEYTCFDKQICIHHHKKSNSDSLSKESSQKTLVLENQISSTDQQTKETIVKVSKDEAIFIPTTETTTTTATTEEEYTNPSIKSPEKEKRKVHDENKEIKEKREETETVEEAVSNRSMINTNNSNTTNTSLTKDTDTTTATIPPNCPTIEQFYQKQILLLQQVYLQKQQQLQYQKQQMTLTQEQLYQNQMYLQQWYNQQQQQLLANCTTYYNKYLQQHFGQVLSQPSKTETTQRTNQTTTTSSTTQPLQTQYVEDEEDYEDDDDDDDYYYSDEDDEIVDDDDYIDNEETQDEKENVPVKEDLFKKVATPNEIAKPSLLSAMIKESNYNEYKKTVEYIQKYDDDTQKISNNIYSIKDYNRNCINSLNKNDRRKRAPSFEDVRNARKLLEMHPLYKSPNIQESNGHSDVEEYYERSHHQFNNTTTSQNSNTTLNTMASQDSHSSVYSSHSHYGIYGSNKTTHSNYSNKSQNPFLNRASNNNSVTLYMNKKRLNHSN